MAKRAVQTQDDTGGVAVLDPPTATPEEPLHLRAAREWRQIQERLGGQSAASEHATNTKRAELRDALAITRRDETAAQEELGICQRDGKLNAAVPEAKLHEAVLQADRLQQALSRLHYDPAARRQWLLDCGLPSLREARALAMACVNALMPLRELERKGRLDSQTGTAFDALLGTKEEISTSQAFGGALWHLELEVDDVVPSAASQQRKSLVSALPHLRAALQECGDPAVRSAIESVAAKLQTRLDDLTAAVRELSWDDLSTYVKNWSIP